MTLVGLMMTIPTEAFRPTTHHPLRRQQEHHHHREQDDELAVTRTPCQPPRHQYSIATALYQSYQPSSPACETTRVNVDEQAPRDIGSFQDWAFQYGIQLVDGIELMAVAENEPGRGSNHHHHLNTNIRFMTTVDLPANTPILFVPNQVLLSTSQARSEIGYLDEAEALFSRLTGVTDESISKFYLLVKILQEWELGMDSPYYPYLNSLPRYFETGASMTAYCASYCLPPYVGKLANQERTRFKQYFKALDYCNHILQKDTISNKELVKWAYNIVFTRSIDDADQGDYKIAPMADMVSTKEENK